MAGHCHVEGSGNFDVAIKHPSILGNFDSLPLYSGRWDWSRRSNAGQFGLFLVHSFNLFVLNSFTVKKQVFAHVSNHFCSRR